ncbi:alanine racemase [Halanaerobium congolense]|jgi:alanine racemase|uniref:Alanine racemase n=1 Tax=Halanaerobium congolense TaxID=54121 RepID=A0A1M7LTT3_9FIRM|nr:alanine racemase [Halanaerobium congolense]TDS28663.1 alanine racemase [Halanaerobium congolense]SDH04026.1 alanine racemase [Halanaerobium congolense]SHM81694.1 alanine racemase [Halanaerobium congolense]
MPGAVARTSTFALTNGTKPLAYLIRLTDIFNKLLKNGGKRMELQLKRPTWIEINLSALKNNYNFIRSKISSRTKIAAVVKANAYGHGAVRIAKELSQLGVEYFCVGSPEEGIELRDTGIKKPILVLAEILEFQIMDVIAGDLIQTTASLETIKALNKAASKLNKIIKVHLKIDTGMGRIGFFPKEINDVLKYVEKLEFIKIEGLFSHLAQADEADKDYSYLQLQKFNSLIKSLNKEQDKIPLIHIANSAAIIDLPETYLDLIRPGIMLYGLLPSNDLNKEADLEPVLAFKTKIIQIRELPANSFISYGSTYKTETKEKLAVLPVGYKDGYPRLLSNQGEVLIRGERAPIRGRVCMGQTIVSVDHLNEVKVGDEVVLIGKQKNEEISASEIAKLCGTINYEIVCNLSERLEKIFLE